MQIARLAARQHGVISRRQLLRLGLDSGAIRYRSRVGRLHLVHRGVYGVGHPARSQLARLMAAVLACGEGAVGSHRTAAAVWAIDPSWRYPVEVTAPSNREHRGVRVYRSRTLAPTDVTVHLGIPVTTPARTLLDLATVLDDLSLARAVNEARVKRLVRVGELAELVARSPRHRGVVRLRPLVERRTAPTRSAFEDAFIAFVDRQGLPRPEVNQRIAGYEVDMLWRRQRLVAELDGRAYHDHAQPFERDRDKDAELLAAGYRVVRITSDRLIHRPEREARRLRRLLAG